MRHTTIALTALLSLLFAREAAATKLIAVLPLDVKNAAGKLDAAAQASLEEMLRDVTADALSPNGWTVLTGETTLQVLQDNGVDAAKCGDQSCHLTMAREIKTEKFISGAVQFVEGEFTASVRLIDTTSGRIVASERLEGHTVRELRKGFEEKATKFFAKGGLTTPAVATPAVAPLPPVNVSGPWEFHYAVDKGEVSTMMLLRQVDDHVTGTYGPLGRIDATISGNDLTGTWTNGDSGAFKIRFSADGSTFEGAWGPHTNPTQFREYGRRGFYVGGIWDTDWTQGDSNGRATVTMTQSGGDVSGSYGPNARCVGHIVGREVKGTWTESTLSGHFTFVFSEDGKTFTGRWSNGDEPQQYTWSGKRH